MNELPVLMPKSYYKNLKVTLDDVIHGNDISTYNVEVMNNFNNLSVVITTNRKREIMVSIRKKLLITRKFPFPLVQLSEIFSI